MNRRSFLSAILVLGMAPAIVRASSLMRVRPQWVGLDLAAGGDSSCFAKVIDGYLHGETGEWYGWRFLSGSQWEPVVLSELERVSRPPLVIHRLDQQGLLARHCLIINPRTVELLR